MQTLLDGRTRIGEAIDRIRYFCPPEGYWLADSGGKDSTVIRWLAQRAGVPFDAHYSVTSCDPPELCHFLRDHHPDTTWEHPKLNMWRGIVRYGYPTRCVRWCCRELKECGGKGRRVLTGIRSEESPRRKARHGLTTLFSGGTRELISPIFDWTSADVWSCIRSHGVPYCPLYDEGWKRLGCVLCPQTRQVGRQTQRWPRLARAWRRAFGRLWDAAPTHTAASIRALRAKWSSVDALWEAWLDRDCPLHGDMQECELFPGSGTE